MNQALNRIMEESDTLHIVFAIDGESKKYAELKSKAREIEPYGKEYEIQTYDNTYKVFRLGYVDPSEKLLGLLDSLANVDHSLFVSAPYLDRDETVVCARDVRAENDQVFEELLVPKISFGSPYDKSLIMREEEDN